MKKSIRTAALAAALGYATAGHAKLVTAEPVVLLHGLARSASSMQKMESALQQAGYPVCNIAYPSRQHDIPTLAQDYLVPALQHCFPAYEGRLHFVTHSMGGILVRKLAQDPAYKARIGRVVMLGPPNHGSEIIDHIGSWSLFRQVAGPAGSQLGTGPHSLPMALGPVDFETGIIAGTVSFNPFLSLLLPGANDGKVTVASARLEGMRELLVLPSSHVFIMRNRQAIANTVHFIRHGGFIHARKG